MVSKKSAVTTEIRQRIIDGRIKLGQQLSENILSAELNTSRQPVREALLDLQSEGLVEVRPKIGTFVFTAERNEREPLLEVRWVLESGAMRLAIEKDSAGLIQTLVKILAAAQTELKAKRLQACEKLDQQFHYALVECAGNDLLAASYHTISHRTSALRYRALLNLVRVAEAIKEHSAIVEQLEKGKVDAASKLLRQHIRQGRLRIVD